MKERQKLFGLGRDAMSNACLNYTGSNYDAMCTGYLSAADELADGVVKNHRGQDTLVYPIAFLYRHYVELRLKQAIAYGQRIVGENVAVPNDHRLVSLWCIARKLLVVRQFSFSK